MRAQVAEMKTSALTSAALAGLLRPMLGDVNMVSAPVDRQGARHGGRRESPRAAQSDYESLITVTVTTERQERSVSGTVFADGKPRLVDIKGIRIDAEFGKSMLYVTNEDKPGFIGKFASLLGDAKRQHRDLPPRPRHSRAATPSRWSRSTATVPATCSSKVQRLPQVQAGQGAAFLKTCKANIIDGRRFCAGRFALRSRYLGQD